MTADDTAHRDDESAETEGSAPSDEDRVKERGRYDDDTPGITDARPGRDDIGESHMPSDYHQAVAQRPVEVKLPEVPDLSEESEGDSSPQDTGGEPATQHAESEAVREDSERRSGGGGGAHAADVD